MEKSDRRLSETKASLILTASLTVLLLIAGFILLGLKRPGWLIGFAIGSVADFVYIWLMHVGASLALKEAKTGLFLLTYFARMALFVGLFALLVVLQYVVKIEVFNGSCWALLIAFVPVTFITIAIQLMHKDEGTK